MPDRTSTIDFDSTTGRSLERAYLTRDVVLQRRTVLERLKLGPGERVLDVGSGPGLLLRELAERVGPEGRAVGVDLSDDMLALARARCQDLAWASVQHADAGALPFDEHAFDAVVSTQVYEYVSDLAAAFRRLFQITRPGGRVAILDTDYDSFVLHTEDPPRHARVMEVWDEHFVHRGLPRVLGTLLRQAGFRVRSTEAIPICNTRWEPDEFSFHLVPMMAGFVAGRAPEREGLARDWLAEQRHLGAAGRYFFSLNRYLVVASRES